MACLRRLGLVGGSHVLEPMTCWVSGIFATPSFRRARGRKPGSLRGDGLKSHSCDLKSWRLTQGQKAGGAPEHANASLQAPTSDQVRWRGRKPGFAHTFQQNKASLLSPRGWSKGGPESTNLPSPVEVLQVRQVSGNARSPAPTRAQGSREDKS